MAVESRNKQKLETANGDTSAAATASFGRWEAQLFWTRLVTAAVIVAFYLGMNLFLLANTSDPGWDHMYELLNGLQAIVLTAAGLLLGTQIQKGVADRAEGEAKKARAEADRHRRQASGGRAMAALARSSSPEARGGENENEYREGHGPYGKPGGGPRPASGDVHGAMLALADEFFPSDEA